MKKFVNEVLNKYPDVSGFGYQYDLFAYVPFSISSSTGLCSRLEFSVKSTLRSQRKSTLTVWIPNGSLVYDNRDQIVSFFSHTERIKCGLHLRYTDDLLLPPSFSETLSEPFLSRISFPPYNPQYVQGRSSFIVPVTPGLALVPAPWCPNHSAAKSALHSASIGLLLQLKDTNVHVMELIPP